MKPRIFIGSSTEALPIAEAFQVALEQNAEIDCHLWTQEIEIGRSVLESLIETPRRFDFGLFIFAPDDRLESQGERQESTRDNVIFEAGLFSGALGRERTFMVLPQGDIDFRIPTDLQGIVQPRYDHERFRSSPDASVGSASTRLRREIERLGPLKSRILGIDPTHMNAFYRQTGLTYAYRRREESKERLLADISRATSSIEMYARVYISELIKDTEGFGRALARAARSADRQVVLHHVSTDPGNDEIAAEVWRLEDPMRTEWETLEQYKSHLRRSDVAFDKLGTHLASADGSAESIRLRRGYLRTIGLPYSLVVIDEHIVYVSFYCLSRNRFGTHAPTMRLVEDPDDDKNWASYFLEERRILAKATHWVE